MLAAAVELAAAGFPVFPLRGKVPAIPKSRGGNGCLDATCRQATIFGWWRVDYPGANIGIRIPDPYLVIDVDPRNGGLAGLQWLETAHGRLPETMTSWSGRGDGGRHLWFIRPTTDDGRPGQPLAPLTSRRLPAGIDLKTSSGYVVAPPSLHPDTGDPYRWAEPWRCADYTPRWLADLLIPEAPSVPAPRPAARPRRAGAGESPADAFTRSVTWRQVLEPAGWTFNRGDGDSDGSSWLHPAATSPCSATIRGGRLYVYSPNTPFEATEPGRPRGYSRFEAWAVLVHGGDMRAAARALRTTGAIS